MKALLWAKLQFIKLWRLFSKAFIFAVSVIIKSDQFDLTIVTGDTLYAGGVELSMVILQRRDCLSGTKLKSISNIQR